MESNPYDPPMTNSEGQSQKKRKGGCWKHIFWCFLILALINFSRFFGSPDQMDEAREVSLFASVIPIIVFYGLIYFVFGRRRSRK
jgi:hypothetical protein